jgi:hypothetical protein
MFHLAPSPSSLQFIAPPDFVPIKMFNIPFLTLLLLIPIHLIF